MKPEDTQALHQLLLQMLPADKRELLERMQSGPEGLLSSLKQVHARLGVLIEQLEKANLKGTAG